MSRVSTSSSTTNTVLGATFEVLRNYGLAGTGGACQHKGEATLVGSAGTPARRCGFVTAGRKPARQLCGLAQYSNPGSAATVDFRQSAPGPGTAPGPARRFYAGIFNTCPGLILSADRDSPRRF